MSTLILYLPAAAPTATTEWPYVLSPDGRNPTAQGQAVGSLLPATGRSTEVVAVVPLQQLSWHRVTLPKGVSPRHARLPAMLAGLLEDQLLDDANELHLALGPAIDSTSEHWIAVCRKDWLQQHLRALEAAGKPVSRIVPELSPEQEAAPTLHFLGTPEQAFWALTDANGGAGVQRGPWPLANDGFWPSVHQGPMVTDPAVSAQAERLAGRTLPIQTPQTRWLNASRSPWDLAQQGLAIASPWRRQLLRGWQALAQGAAWRPVRWGIAAVLVIQVLGINAWAWKERRDWQTRQTATRALLTQNFPKVQVVVDAPVQMRREVDNLRLASGQASAQDFESLLSAAAAAIPPEQSPTAVDYDGRELTLKGLTLSPEATQDTQNKLRARGYTAESDGSNLKIREDLP